MLPVNTMMGLIDERAALMRIREELAAEILEVEGKIQAKTDQLSAYLKETNAVLIHHDGRVTRAYFSLYGELHCHPAAYSHEVHASIPLEENTEASVSFDFSGRPTQEAANGCQA